MYTFIESSIFERELPLYLDDDEYTELQLFLMSHPEAGNIIPRSGGVRKLRWKRSGTGKRGGVRVIYFVRRQPSEIWMLTIYAKAKHDNIPAHILRALKEGFDDES
jgi:mRNA-degrading endonuclease RelE of RelBE toxin-antitoxin system